MDDIRYVYDLLKLIYLRIQKEQEEEYIKQQNEFKIIYHYTIQYESIKPTGDNDQ
jgi:hypothetical protein